MSQDETNHHNAMLRKKKKGKRARLLQRSVFISIAVKTKENVGRITIFTTCISLLSAGANRIHTQQNFLHSCFKTLKNMFQRSLFQLTKVPWILLEIALRWLGSPLMFSCRLRHHHLCRWWIYTLTYFHVVWMHVWLSAGLAWRKSMSLPRSAVPSRF